MSNKVAANIAHFAKMHFNGSPTSVLRMTLHDPQEKNEVPNDEIRK